MKSVRMWMIVTLSIVVVVLGLVGYAPATVPGTNGLIVWGRFNPEIGDDDIYTANPDGTDEVKVAGPSECPRWSPDGNRIVLPGITVINWDGSNPVQFSSGTTQNFGCAIWSADGSRIAFESWDDANSNFVPGVFSIRSSDGGDLKRLTAATAGHDIPGDYSPDGTRLVFLGGAPHKKGAIFVANADGTDRRQITPWGLAPGDFAPRWSPDGSRIVFVSNGSLFLVNPDGSDLRKVFQDTGGRLDLAPAWSPDGKKILFVRIVFAGQPFEQSLYIVNTDGTALTQVRGPHTSGPVQHPDWGVHAQ
jgi:TolB protein